MSIPRTTIAVAAGACALVVPAVPARAVPDLDDGAVHTVVINYVPGELTVYVDDMTTPALAVPVDLRDVAEPGLGVLGPDGRAWVGFTAGRGAGPAHQDILAWRLDPPLGEHTQVATHALVGFNLADFGDVTAVEMRGDAAQAGDRLRIVPAEIGPPRSSGNSLHAGPMMQPIPEWTPWVPLPSPVSLTDPGTCFDPAYCFARGSAWHAQRHHLAQGFSTAFRFQMTKVQGDIADGFAFVVQNESIDALGGDGGLGLGYWDGHVYGSPIRPALAIEFDAFANGHDPAGPGHPCGCTHDPGNHVSLNITVSPATVYAVDTASDRLVRLDADTGTVTPIGPLGFDALAIDLTRSGGRLYAAHSDPAGPERLYVLDHATGGATLVGDVSLAGAPVDLVKSIATRPDGSLVIGFGDAGRAYRIGDMGFGGDVLFHANLRSTGAPDPDLDALAMSRTGRLMGADTDADPGDDHVCFADVATIPPRYDVASICPRSPELGAADDIVLANGSIYALDAPLQRVHRIDPETGAVLASVPVEPGYALHGIVLAPATLCPADVDHDNDVDVFDFGALIDSFGTGGHVPFTGGDLDGDGDVDVYDFARFATGFGCGS